MLIIALTVAVYCGPPVARASAYNNDICENNYIFKVNSLCGGDGSGCDAAACASNGSQSIEMPVLANGHIAFIPNGDSIYMNGVYNGLMDETHRARIPNLAQIRFAPCGHRPRLQKPLPTMHVDSTQRCSASTAGMVACRRTLDIKRAVYVYSVDCANGQFTVEQAQYAHRHFDRAIVNQITIKRNAVDTHSSSGGNHRSGNNATDDNAEQQKGPHKFEIKLEHTTNSSSVDLTEATTIPIALHGHRFVLYHWKTQIIEDPLYQNDTQDVYVLQQRVPETIQLNANVSAETFTWITLVGRNKFEVLAEAEHALANIGILFNLHTFEWLKFWNESSVCVDGHDELDKVIHASLFALASSLPALNASQPRHLFYNLSPSGLGKGGPNFTEQGYRGHSFWDTDIWMQPSILLLEPQWSRELLYYRYLVRAAAADNARKTGYEGLRYPWESALTGRDVTLADYPEIVEYQQHVTADVGFALRKHIFATHDNDLLRQFGCELATGTATFWASRIAFNRSSDLFDINGVMGPDEDHYNVNNNAYTNVAAAMNLHFGSYANCLCNQLAPAIYSSPTTNWSTLASSIKLLYDAEKNYMPQYDGYTPDMEIKQADVVLLAYPLQYRMNVTTKRNNLNIYANVTRATGPAMTWSMHALGHLDIGETPNESLFNSTHLPYIRWPFYTWNEYVNGVRNGAENFITGAGGFLQLIIYGYAGIRLNTDALIINGAQLPPRTTRLYLNGISYLHARFHMEIQSDAILITFYRNRTNVLVCIDGTEQQADQIEFKFDRNQTVEIKSSTPWFKQCPLPADDLNKPFSAPKLLDKHVILVE